VRRGKEGERGEERRGKLVRIVDFIFPSLRFSVMLKKKEKKKTPNGRGKKEKKVDVVPP